MKSIPFFVTAMTATIWMGCWVIFVDPFPERDAINQFYFPFINYLKLSSLINADHNFLTESSFLGNYPSGGAIFGWLISQFHMQKFFIENPFSLSLGLILPLSIIPYFFKMEIRNRILLGITIVALPVIQICFKGFSLHAYNVIYALIAILAFRSYLAKNQIRYLVFFAIFFWVSVICKHLGAFYFLNFVLAYLTWVVGSRKIDYRVILTLILVGCMSTSFYSFNNLESYLVNVITHNPYLSIKSFAVLGGLILATGIILIIICKRSSSLKFLPRFNSQFLLSSILLLFATYLTTIPYDAEVGNIDVILYSIVGYGALIRLVLSYEIKSIRGFMVLFGLITFTNSTLLFCSMIGKTYYNFFLPVGLLAIFEFATVRSLKKRLSYLFCAVLLSNFFPSISTLHKFMGERGENIYINGLNAVYINPLGWEPCEIPALRENLAKRYSKVDLVQDNSLYVVTGIHFHTKLGLEFPKNYFFHFPSTYRLDHLPNENIKELLNKYKQKGTALFSDWLNQKTVPFVMIATKSYTNFVGRPIRTEEIIEQDEPDLNEFAQSLNYAYIDFLEQEFKLSNYYDCNLITTKKPRIKICVLKSLNAKADYSPKWNRELSDLATNYEMQNNRSLPDWVEFLDANNQKRLYKKAAGTLYTEAEQAYGIKPTWQIYVLLQRALQFDPTHIGAVEDALSLQKKLTAHDWELIPSNYKPIEPDFLEKALRESKMNVESFEFGLLESMSPTEKAQRLFVLSNSYFQSDPARCIKLLEQALLHNPNHTEAFKDLQVLKAQIKKTQ